MSLKIKICKESGCLSSQTTSGFCRFHYLKNWKEIQSDKKEKATRKLKNYIEHILKKDPDRSLVASKKNESDLEQPEPQNSNLYTHDEFDDVLANLGYRDDLDELLNNIKVDRDF